MRKTLYIVDIFSFIFRAYYAIRPLHAPDGTPVNAVYGVITMLKRLIDTKKPDHLVVCMESKEKKNFRLDVFPEYKANRGAPPEDLRPQIGLIEEFVRTYPMQTLSVPGFEADDIIATLVKRYCAQPDIDVYIVSPDKDLMQLVCDNVFLYDTMKEQIMGMKDVVEKFGVTADKVVEVQSLCGDPTDNIPGIPGVGLKTAAKLIQEFGSLDRVLENAAQIKGKLGEKITQGRDSALMSRKLVALEENIPLDLKWEDLEFKPANPVALNEFFLRLGFKSLVMREKQGELLEERSATAAAATASVGQKRDPAEFTLIKDTAQLKSVLEEFHAQENKLFVFDTETDALSSLYSNLVGISFCFEEKKSYYIPLAHKSDGNLELNEVRSILLPIFSDPKIPKAGQNAKFDMNVLSRAGFLVEGLVDDTLIASYIINPEGSHSLDTLAMRYLHHNMIAFTDVVKRGQNFSDVALEDAARYSAEDAWATFAIVDDLRAELKKMDVETVYRDIEVPLVSLLSEMEQHGILVDKDLLGRLDQQFSTRLKELEVEIYKLADQEFNINSPKQLCEILFEKLKLPVVKKTKTGYSTDVKVLQVLANLHELPKLLLEFRTISKLQSTYVVQLQNLIHPDTGRIHSTFNQAIVATGRLSSSDPNLQNIPIKTQEGRKIREVFIAPPGSYVFSADYSQIELRLMAAFSQDPQLVEAYRNNQDIHRITASYIFGISLDQITDRQRSIGKTINFGVIYGQSAFGLSQILGIPREEASHFIKRFYEQFSRVRLYKEEVLEKARKDGFVATFLGRKRFLPELNSRNKMNQLEAERAAFNAIFQGSAADLIKKAMLDIRHWLKKEKFFTKMVLQVHDELLFEVPEAELQAVRQNIPSIMVNALKLEVPLEVSFKHGKNWGEAH